MRFKEFLISEAKGIDWEKEINTNKNLWVTQHSIIGSRVNGTHLVNAKSKAEANKIVKALDSDYTRIKSWPVKKWADMHGDVYVAIPDNEKLPKPGKAEFIEAGT